MGDFSDQKNKVILDIKEIGSKFQIFIRQQYADNPDFKSAVDEADNSNNDNLILNVFKAFGVLIQKITGTYVEQVDSQLSLDELKSKLRQDLETILGLYNTAIEKAVNDLLTNTLTKIEASDFLTEVVTNPDITPRQASRDLRKL